MTFLPKAFIALAFLCSAAVLMTYNQRSLEPLTDACSQKCSPGPAQGIEATWTIKDRIRYAETAYQDVVARRTAELKRRNFGNPAFNPWDSWMAWWPYFPAAFNCPFDIRRVGNFGDGGKWVCGMQLFEASKAAAEEAKTKGLGPPKDHRPCIVYSLGVATESSFEDEILKKTDCEIWAFDGSVNQMEGGITNHPRVHFHKVFVGEDKTSEPGQTEAVPWKSLSTIMQENNHQWIDILKIDIEGDEYGLINLLTADPRFVKHPENNNEPLFPFSQLQIELHLINPAMDAEDPESFPIFLNWFQKLESWGLRPFWSELNLIPMFATSYEQGVWYSEFSFINILGKHRLVDN